MREFIERSDDKYIATEWLSDDKMKVYVRRGLHYINGEGRSTLDIANVAVDEEYQGRGIFTEFLEEAHKMNPWDATYVECVHNPALAAFLLKRFWLPMGMEGAESFYMVKKEMGVNDTRSRLRRLRAVSKSELPGT